MEDIERRLQNEDITLVNELSVGEMLDLYLECWCSRNMMFFINDVLIPEKSYITRTFLKRNEWEVMTRHIKYDSYIVLLLSFLDKKNDKEGIEEVEDLIIREKVNIDAIFIRFLNVTNTDILRFIININPESAKWILKETFYRAFLLTPQLVQIFTFLKGKMTKEEIRKVLEEIFSRYYGEIKIITAVLESGLVEFKDLYEEMTKRGVYLNIVRINEIIESQI